MSEKSQPEKRPRPRDLLVRAADLAGMTEESFRHPLNPESELHGYLLSRKAGLTRIGVNLMRVPPRRESFVYHCHENEEEFVYVLSGRGVCEIGEEAYDVGPGDFLGFPAGGLAHHIKNPGPEDLVYLCGGENCEVEISDFPRLGKVLVRRRKDAVVYPAASGVPLFGK
jgi:uncharacterized cupin superfamily protein